MARYHSIPRHAFELPELAVLSNTYGHQTIAVRMLWLCPPPDAILVIPCAPAGHSEWGEYHGLDCSGFRRSLPLLRN